MKERIGRVGARGTGNKLPKFAGRARFALAMIALAMLCVSALAQENTANDWYKKGLEFEGTSKEETIKAFDKAIQLDPENATIWDDMAWSLDDLSRRNHDLGKYNKALQAYNKSLGLYDKVLEVNPKNAEAWFKKGIVFNHRASGRGSAINVLGLNSPADYRAWDYDNEKTIKCADKAIEINPRFTRAWLLRGWAMLHIPSTLPVSPNRLQEAIKCFEKAAEIEPSNSNVVADVQAGKAAALAKLGKQNESIEAFDGAIEASPNDIQLWIDKAVQFADQGNYEETIKAFDKAAEIDPQNIYVWLSRGVILSRNLSKYNESLDAYDKAIQIDPQNINAWEGKGYALKALGQDSEAEKAFAKARELEYQG